MVMDDYPRRLWQKYTADNNRLYRLFHAALRARFGLADASAWLQKSGISLPTPVVDEQRRGRAI